MLYAVRKTDVAYIVHIGERDILATRSEELANNVAKILNRELRLLLEILTGANMMDFTAANALVTQGQATQAAVTSYVAAQVPSDDAANQATLNGIVTQVGGIFTAITTAVTPVTPPSPPAGS